MCESLGSFLLDRCENRLASCTMERVPHHLLYRIEPVMIERDMRAFCKAHNRTHGPDSPLSC